MGRLLMVFFLAFYLSEATPGYFRFKNGWWPARSSISTPEGWDTEWEPVSGVFSPAPASKLEIKWLHTREVSPGASVGSGAMTERPAILRWNSEPGALYTLMVLDGGIDRVLPKMYLHWMVTNIPNNNVMAGVEVMNYITPFSLEFTEEGEFITDPVESGHPLIIAVFKQNTGKILTDEAQRGCTKDITDGRIHDYEELAGKYNLELVAGNWLSMPYSGKATHDMVCRISKCLGEVWPFPLPGINDLEECKPRTDIVDITTRGPKTGKEEQYFKFGSSYSPDSLSNIVKDTFPVLSTGNGKEFRALEGALGGGPFVENNLAETLDGVVDMVFFNYQNKSAAEGIFFEWFKPEPTINPSPNKTPVLQRVAPLFETIYFPPLSVVLSTPDDQDFDIETTVAEEPGWVFDVLITKTKEGREEEFEELRKLVQKRMFNSRDVEQFYTFTVNRDIVTDERAALKDDTERVELTIANHVSREARTRALGAITQYDKFWEWADTFECVTCGLMTDIVTQQQYPPYDEL